MSDSLRLSYVIVTHNRREPLLRTLRILTDTTPLPPEQWEIRIVDNASTDGTAEAVAEQFPGAHYQRRARNDGVHARSYAFEPARGQYLCLLDDDSYPLGDAVARSIAYLDARPTCAAVVGNVQLPDGTREACAFPAVMLSGAVVLRKSATLRVGGFRREFFRKAGEYDFSFRLWQAGFSVERFEDILYRHDKVATGRSKPFAHRMDLRNNLILVERFFPASLRRAYRDDFTQRYSAIARHERCGRAALLARAEAALWRIREWATGRQTLSPAVIETVLAHAAQRDSVARWAADRDIKRVVIADLSKNLHATHRACLDAGLTILAIADDAPAFAGLRYRGIDVLPTGVAAALAPDGVVLSNVNPAQVDTRLARVAAKFAGPILRLWEPTYLRLPSAADASHDTASPPSTAAAA